MSAAVGDIQSKDHIGVGAIHKCLHINVLKEFRGSWSRFPHFCARHCLPETTNELQISSDLPALQKGAQVVHRI